MGIIIHMTKKQKMAKCAKRSVSFYKYTNVDMQLLATNKKLLKDTYQQKTKTIENIYDTPSSKVLCYYIDDDKDLFDTNIYLKFEFIHDIVIITIAEHPVFDILKKIRKFLEKRNVLSTIENDAIYINSAEFFSNEIIHKKLCNYLYKIAIKIQ